MSTSTRVAATARHCTALGAARAKRSGLLETDQLAVGAAGEAVEAGDADAVTGFKRRGSATTSPRKRRTAGTKIIPCKFNFRRIKFFGKKKTFRSH